MNPFAGKLNRFGFLLWTLFAVSIGAVFALIIDLTKNNHIGTYWLGLRVLVAFVVAALILFSAVKRLEDMDRSPLWALLLIIPFISPFTWLVLVLVPSKSHRP